MTVRYLWDQSSETVGKAVAARLGCQAEREAADDPGYSGVRIVSGGRVIANAMWQKDAPRDLDAIVNSIVRGVHQSTGADTRQYVAPPPGCLCGCGQAVTKSKWGRPRRFYSAECEVRFAASGSVG